MEEGLRAELPIPLKHNVMSLYPDRLLDHFKNPRHAGVLAPPALVVQVENPACGDILKLSARIDGGRVVEAAFQVRGCTASIAAGSALAAWLHGQSIESLKTFRESVIDDALGGLPPASRHAAVLCASAVQALLAGL
jgi:nitrogen fixation NifU-like protein